MTTSEIDRARRAALDRIDRAERGYKFAFVVAALVEASFLGAFVLLADLGDRLHLLLLLMFVGTYTLVAVGLLVLGAHVNRCAERVLRALDEPRSSANRG